MILAKNESGELCLISYESIRYRPNYKFIRVITDCPPQLRTITKDNRKITSLIERQKRIMQKAENEVKTRKKLLDYLAKLEEGWRYE